MALTITPEIQSNIDYLTGLGTGYTVTASESLPSVATELSTEYNINLGPYVTFEVTSGGNLFHVITSLAFAGQTNSLHDKTSAILSGYLTKWFSYIQQLGSVRNLKTVAWFIDSSLTDGIKLDGGTTIAVSNYTANLATLVTSISSIPNVTGTKVMTIIDEGVLEIAKSLPADGVIKIVVTMTSDYATQQSNNKPEFSSLLGSASWDNPDKHADIISYMQTFIANRKTHFPQV
jgi:hypothetical protein